MESDILRYTPNGIPYGMDGLIKKAIRRESMHSCRMADSPIWATGQSTREPIRNMSERAEGMAGHA